MWAVVALVIGGVGGYYVGVAMPSGQSQGDKSTVPTATSNEKQKDFSNAMRKVWEDHITWTRLYIVEAVAGNPGASQSAARLLKNQEDIGTTIKPYYGSAAGDQLTALLKTHIQGAVDILSAAKANDQQKLAVAKTAWYNNADQIATFLSKANPAEWPEDAMQAHMKTHLDLTLAEAVAELQGKYADSIANYDSVHGQILELADMLSHGIILQFPAQF